MSGGERINSERRGRQIMREICRALHDHEGIDLGDGSWIGFSLKTPDELRRQAGTVYCRWPGGYATHSWRREGGHLRKTEYRISIRQGLSRADFSACCAHELGHIYLYRHGFPDVPIIISEGLCELFRFAWFKTKSRTVAEHELRRLLANPDPVYGAGFRMACQSLLDRTLKEVLEHVKVYGHLPPSEVSMA